MQAADPRAVALANEIAHLRGLELDGLRARWRSLTGRAAPAHVPRTLLLRVLAYRLQAAALADLDRASARLLERIASAGRAGKQAAIPVPDRMGLKPGTVLVREWEGTPQHVMVLADGFAWNDNTYQSLSGLGMSMWRDRVAFWHFE